MADTPSFFGPWLTVKGGASKISLMRRVQMHEEATREIQKALGASTDDAWRTFTSVGAGDAIERMTDALTQQRQRIQKLVARVDEAQSAKLSEIDKMLDEAFSSAMGQSAEKAAINVILPYLPRAL